MTDREFAARYLDLAAEAIEAMAAAPLPVDASDAYVMFARAERLGMWEAAQLVRSVAASHRVGQVEPKLRIVS